MADEVPNPRGREPELYLAARENDEAKVRLLLEQDVIPTHVDKANGWTALHWAVKYGNVRMVKALLEYGASRPYHDHCMKQKELENKLANAAAEEEDDEDDDELGIGVLADEVLKNTPLLWAAFKGNLRIVRMLLEDGYSPNDVDSLGNNAVHLAAACGYKQVLQTLILDGGSANAVNIYKNQPIDSSTNPEIREILEIAMKEGASMTVADIELKHQQHLRTYLHMVEEFEAVLSDAKKFDDNGALPVSSIPQITTALANALQDAKDRDLDEDSISEGEKLLIRLELTHELHTDISNLKQQLPLRSQKQYIDYVHQLESTITRAAMVKVDSTQLQVAKDLIAQAHIEYWLSVRIARVVDVHRAEDPDEHDMTCLRNTIEKAKALNASVELLEQGSSLLARLDCELAIHRALVSVPSYRLPLPEPEEGYWQPEDQGHIQETEGFPLLPPDMTEYIWLKSEAYLAVEACIEQLRACTEDVYPTTNAEATAEAKEKLARLEKDMKVLELKDSTDKLAAVEAAIKAAKKLKRGKKKGGKKK